jgi:hypothetical protein
MWIRQLFDCSVLDQYVRETFGERAIYPLTITETVPWTPLDIEVVRSGFFAPLPDAAEGVQVFCFYRSRLTVSDPFHTIEKSDAFPLHNGESPIS